MPETTDRCAPPKSIPSRCGCATTPGNCDCQTNLAIASPTPLISGLETRHGGFSASLCGLLSHNGEPCSDLCCLGFNWLSAQEAYVTTEGDDLGFVFSTDRAYWFTPQEGGTFLPQFGVRAKLTHSGSEYILTEEDGTAYVFSDTTKKLLSATTPGGQTTENTYDGDCLAESRRTIPGPDSEITEIRRYQRIAGGPNDGRLEIVTLLFEGSPASPVRRLMFTYYGSDDPSGSLNDLQTVSEQAWEDGQWVTLSTRLFRYYKDGDADGAAHLLKYDLGSEGFSRLSASIDPLTASDEQVARYADAFYKYNPETARLTEIRLAGGTRTYLVDYQENTAESYVPGYNVWKTRTQVTHPNGYVRVFYANHVQQEILNVLRHPTDPDIFWANFTEYVETSESGLEANNAKVLRTVPPAGVTGYAETGTTPFLEVELVAADKAAFRTYRYGDGSSYQPAGYVIEERITNGDEDPDTGGVPVARFDYHELSVAGSLGTLVLPRTSTQIPDPDNDDSDHNITTSYEYDLYPAFPSGDLPQIAVRTTAPPVIPTAQNGNGVGYFVAEEFDIQGRLTAVTDERGVRTQYEYDDATGARVQTIEDVGYGRLNLTTAHWVDNLGRTILTLKPLRSAENGYQGQPVREAQFTVHRDGAHEVWSAAGYAVGTDHGPQYTFVLTNPVQITKMDHDGRTTDQISAVRDETVGQLSGGEVFPRSSWVRWMRSIYDDSGRLAATRVYHDIPAAGEGLPGVNFVESRVGYDIMGRRNVDIDAAGNIARRVFDPRGLTLSAWVGTNDTGATEDNPAGPAADPALLTPNNMRPVVLNEFDDGLSGGDGLLTTVTLPVDDDTANNRVTEHEYDFRDRRTMSRFILDDTHQFESAAEYDNLDRVTAEERAKRVSGDSTRIARSEQLYDKRNRVFRTATFAVDPDTGAVGNALVSDRWFDQSGNEVCNKPAGADLFTKTQRDAVGRVTATYTGYYAEEYESLPPPIPYARIYNPISNAIVLDHDVVMEQAEQEYDEAGNATRRTIKRRRDDADGTTGSLADDDTQPKARTTRADAWTDGSGRTIAAANYGTAEFPEDRSSVPPDSTDDVLVSQVRYNDRGEAFETVDPAGKVTRVNRDHAGREIEVIDNCIPHAPREAGCAYCIPHAPREAGCAYCIPHAPREVAGGGGLMSDIDTNITVRKSYTAAGQVASLTAVNAATGDQTTRYVYGTSPETSGITRNDLLVEEVYPDAADAGDHVFHVYNRQGERVSTTDQNGTRHEFTRDRLGRQTADAVAQFGSGIDDAVAKIARTYDERGLPEHVTSFDTDDAAVNDVQFAFNDFGQLVTEWQEHGGTVDTDITPKIEYAYAPGSDDVGRTNNTIRRTGVTYPNGRELGYDYGSPGDKNDRLSRVEAIDFDGETGAVEYTYLGLGAPVKVDYVTPGVFYSLLSDSDPARYVGLDSFDRVTDCRWTGTEDDVARIQYGYDPAGNRTFRRDVVARDAEAQFDELYTYDRLHRLKSAARGLLSDDPPPSQGGAGGGSGSARLESVTFSQAWNLDATGNWSRFSGFDNQSGTLTALDQTRGANPANEITGITALAGPAWVQPAYDRAGNMTSMPQPADPTVGFAAVYDAWNRLVRVIDTATAAVIQLNQYDGLMRRTLSAECSGLCWETLTLDQWRLMTLDGWRTMELAPTLRHYYYSDSWQVLEERLGSTSGVSPLPDRQFFWGLRYIDDLIFRDRTTDELLDERLYALQDANWNVIAICDTTGEIKERYAYSPYGMLLFLALDFTPLHPNASGFAWETLFCGYRHEHSTGLYRARFRDLQPVLGGWLNRDPFRNAANLLRYVRSNPVGLTDPLGLQDTSPGDALERLAYTPSGRSIDDAGVGEDSKIETETEQAGISLACGRLAHILISMDIQTQNKSKDKPVYVDWPISTISRMHFDKPPVPCCSKRRPDLVLMDGLDPLNTGEVYEIKHDSLHGRTAGPVAVADYVNLLNQCGFRVSPGSGHHAGVNGGPIESSQGCGTLTWKFSHNGLILYNWADPPRIPIVGIPERLRQKQEQNTVVKKVLEETAFWGSVAAFATVLYWTVSELSRVFPLRNLIPLP